MHLYVDHRFHRATHKIRRITASAPLDGAPAHRYFHVLTPRSTRLVNWIGDGRLCSAR
jgi:hypothetical protein